MRGVLFSLLLRQTISFHFSSVAVSTISVHLRFALQSVFSTLLAIPACVCDGVPAFAIYGSLLCFVWGLLGGFWPPHLFCLDS